MLSSYWPCNIHLILKSFVGLIYIRVVPCTTRDPAVECNICDDVNLDVLLCCQGERVSKRSGLSRGLIIRRLWHQGWLIPLCTALHLSISSMSYMAMVRWIYTLWIDFKRFPSLRFSTVERSLDYIKDCKLQSDCIVSHSLNFFVLPKLK